MRRHSQWALAALFFIACALAPTAAQNPPSNQGASKPPLYTYVSEWAVPRAQWADMAKLDTQDRGMLDKFVADGTLLNYGQFANLVHQEGQPTHGSWFSANSMANLMKVLGAEMAAPGTTAPVLANSKHWDYVFVSTLYNGKPTTQHTGYIVGGNFVVKPGHGKDFDNLMKNQIIPMMEKLLADGAIDFYTLNNEEIVEHPGMVTFVYTTSEASGMDKVDAAFNELMSKDPTFGQQFEAAVVPDSEHDFLDRITYMNHK
jgi:hypothetical protein